MRQHHCGGWQRLFEQCTKKLQNWYHGASQTMLRRSNVSGRKKKTCPKSILPDFPLGGNYALSGDNEAVIRGNYCFDLAARHEHPKGIKRKAFPQNILGPPGFIFPSRGPQPTCSWKLFHKQVSQGTCLHIPLQSSRKGVLHFWELALSAATTF